LTNRRLTQLDNGTIVTSVIGTNVSFITAASTGCISSICQPAGEVLLNQTASDLVSAIASGSLFSKIVETATTSNNDTSIVNITAINKDSVVVSNVVIQVISTDTPTSKPTAQPSAKPSAKPTSQPTACMDSSGIFAWPNGDSHTCQWVSANLLAGTCSVSVAKINCPYTCNMCSSATNSPTTAPTSVPTGKPSHMSMKTKAPSAKPIVRALLTVSHSNKGLTPHSSACNDSAGVFR